MKKTMKNYPATKLYTVEKNVKCIKCECKGAIQAYGEYYPEGVGPLADKIKSYEPVRENPHMDDMFGPGGTIPHECLNCGNRGLIDYGGLEGFEMAFVRIADSSLRIKI